MIDSHRYRDNHKNGRSGIFDLRQWANRCIGVLLFVVSSGVFASVSSPASNSTGSYTVSWNNQASSTYSSHCNLGGNPYVLTERKNGDIYNVRQITSASTKSSNVSGRGAGTYTYQLRVRYCSSSGAFYSYTNTSTTTVFINHVNKRPVITGVPATTINENSTYSFTPTASDPDGKSISFSITGKPSWASFSTSTGKLSGTPSDSQSGTYSNIKITASDGVLTKQLPTFTITVNKPPVADGTTWIPIAVGDISIIIPFTPTELFSAPSNVNVSLINGVNTLSWDDVEHASKFQVQALNAQGKWVTIATTVGLSVTLTGNNANYTSFRVVACNYGSCEGTGDWGENTSVRKIIFIHTDLLGSPVAETDINGDVK